MNYGTKQRISGFLKAAGLTALFAIGMSEPDSKPPTEEERIENRQRSQGCTEEQIAQYKHDGVPPHCPER